MFNKRGNVKTMNCNEVKCRLSSFQDNELDAAAKAAVQAHLDECENCREEYRALEAVYRGIDELRDVEPAQNFTAMVMSRVKRSATAADKARFTIPAVLRKSRQDNKLLANSNKEKEKRRRFAVPSFVYSMIFIVFFFLGILITTNLKDGAPPDREEIYAANILIESQDLSLINIQDNTLAMLYSGGKKHGK